MKLKVERNWQYNTPDGRSFKNRKDACIALKLSSVQFNRLVKNQTIKKINKEAKAHDKFI